MRSVLGHLKAVLAREGGLSDGQLLQRFLARRDESAFAALVRRHGPMVLGVCRRILRNGHDADDAFQATFLVLVRKARALARRTVVGDWLHGVAYRTALKARAADALRRVKERTMLRSETFKEVLLPEWHDLLDRELNGLPEKYRTPIILCDLEGRTRREAARLLRCPEGTISGRLSRARALLARRLARQGLTLSGGAVALALSEATAAGVPSLLVTSTAKAAASVVAGQAALGGAVSPQVAALSEGVLKAMLLAKLRTVTAVLLAVGLLGLGAATGLFPIHADEPPTARTGPAAPGPRNPRVDNRDVERLPPGTLPRPAYVLLTSEGVEISTASMEYQIRESRDNDGQTKYWQPVPVTNMMRVTRQIAQIYDMHGKKVGGKRLTEIMNQQILALVLFTNKRDGDELRSLSLYLSMFKEDTLLFVIALAPPPQWRPIPAAERPVPPLPAPPLAPEQPRLAVPYQPRTAAPPAPVPPAPVPPPPTLFVDSKRFKLPYAFSNPGTVSSVELWHTSDDGRTWEKFRVQPADTDHFLVEVAKEGLHGFTIIAVNDDKLSQPRPRPGDLPQAWVEVDPYDTVTMATPELVNKGTQKLLILRYKVMLKDLPDRPIYFSYAASKNGPWLPMNPRHIDTGVPNAGRYLWEVPANAPERIWIRLQVKTRRGDGPTLLNGPVQLNPVRPLDVGIIGAEPQQK
jgi:RNA polymerase sigma factor (sigma-70 family)